MWQLNFRPAIEIFRLIQRINVSDILGEQYFISTFSKYGSYSNLYGWRSQG